ncbi:transglutaminase family protein [Schlesneria paludicola]|uniref:transglutaminase family protein n=1 Tax=Schlesneria paludicola TaxID=360056 RepID=UPI00029AC602|nr:transglutaminase family protein [Schlesneria paludicola]
MHYNVRHTTIYSYADAVSLCQNEVHLTPRQTPFQSCAGFQLDIAPDPVRRRSRIDAFGNQVWYFSLEEPHHELQITARSRVSIAPRELPIAGATQPWEQVRDQLIRAESPDMRQLAQFRFESPFVQLLDEVRDYALVSFTPKRPLLEAALDLMSRIFREFKYAPTTTSISTPTREVMKLRRGVCQDFAHLQICALRCLGLAARYVSGYLVTAPPPGKPKLIGADASHAWLSVYCPGDGWIDLDPTNNVIPQQRHVTIGWGRDYSDVCPIQGVLTGGGSQILTVSVDVAQILVDQPA